MRRIRVGAAFVGAGCSDRNGAVGADTAVGKPAVVAMRVVAAGTGQFFCRINSAWRRNIGEIGSIPKLGRNYVVPVMFALAEAVFDGAGFPSCPAVGFSQPGKISARGHLRRGHSSEYVFIVGGHEVPRRLSLPFWSSMAKQAGRTGVLSVEHPPAGVDGLCRGCSRCC